VPEPEPAFRYLAALGYAVGEQAYDPLQRVNLALRHHAVMPDVEVIWPRQGEASPLDKLLERSGAQVYHWCYAVEDVAAVLRGLEQLELCVLPVTPPTPAVLFGGREVSFYQIDGFGLIELIHADPG